MPVTAINWHLKIAPEQLGETIREVAQDLAESGKQVSPQAVLYAEKVTAFQCRTCLYARPQNATHGRCRIMTGPINLDEGCCCAWEADPRQLHLYKAPTV